MFRGNYKFLKHMLLDLIIGGVLALFIYLYSPNWAHPQDYFFISGFLLFTFGWIVYISNEGLFDLPIYGIQQFFKGILGIKMEKTYLEYRSEKVLYEKTTFLALWTSSAIMFIIGIVFYIIIQGGLNL